MTTFARNSLARTAAQLVGKVCLFLWTVLLAKQLHPAGFGSYAYLAAVITLLGVVSDYGLAYLVTNRVARDPDSAAAYLTHAQALRMLLGLAAYGLLIGLALTAPAIKEYAGAALLFGATILTTSMINGYCAVLNGREELHWSSLLQAMLPAATLAFGFWLLGGTAAGGGGAAPRGQAGASALARAVLPHLMAGILVTVTAALLFRAKRLFYTRRLEFRFLRDLMRLGFPYLLMVLLGTLNVSLDTLLLKAIRGEDAVGMYNASYKLVLALMILPTAFGEAAFPIWSRTLGRGLGAASPSSANAPTAGAPRRQGQKGQISLLRVLGPLLALGLCAALGLTVAAPVIVSRLYGSAYAASVPVLRVHAWTLLLMFLNFPLGYRLIAQNRLNDVIRTFAAVVLLNGALNLLLIPSFGPLGAAWTTLASETANCLLLIRQLRKPESRTA